MSPFFKHVQKGFPRFATGQSIFLIHVVWVHFQVSGFPDGSVHYLVFEKKKFLYPVVEEDGHG